MKMLNKYLAELNERMNRASSIERGFALPAVILVMVLVSALALASLMTTGDERAAGRALRESAKAFYAAEAGANAVIANWDNDSYDTLMPLPGDSLDMGWQTLENGSSYKALLTRVDGGSGGRMYAARVTGRGVGGLAGEHTLGVVFATTTSSSSWPTQTVVFGGTMELSGSPTISGACGGLHVNGDVTKGAKNLTLDGDLTSTGTSEQGDYVDSNGDPYSPQENADSVPMPQLDPLDYCPSDADFILRDNYFVTVGPPMDSAVVGSDSWGWSIEMEGTDPFYPKFKLGGSGTPESGTLCVMGNVELSGGAGMGSDGSPIDMSIIATGNVQITGTSFIAPDREDGIAILAGGDLELSGSAGVSSDNFEGLIYVHSQCDISGSATVAGQMICRDEPNAPGTWDYADFNEFSGSVSVSFDCTGHSFITTETIGPLGTGGWSQVVN